MTEFKHKGQTYLRDVEMLGDVESIKWFVRLIKMDLVEGYDSEIYDHEHLTELEEAFESAIVSLCTPPLSII